MLVKNIFLVAVFFLLGFNSIAQTYSVLHTEGTIFKTATQKALVTGDTFSASDSLSFPKLLSWAVVISASGDLLFVQSSEATTKASKTVVTTIERGLHPVKRKENLPVKDLSAYFKGDQFVFIGNDFSLPIDTESYELNEKLFLLYRYEYNSRIITHKIPFNKERISFHPAFLYEYKGEKIPAQKTTNTELAHFDSNTNLPTFVARFRPIWLNEEQLKKELQILVKVYESTKKMKESKLNTTALFLGYVQDIYGQTDEFYFSEWVQKSYYGK
ncbi:MAG: hypothetical protein H7282_15935 [Cytophagaceae bacterium]|nr:hypothetical protein [Cytophagaceae bacterium]